MRRPSAAAIAGAAVAAVYVLRAATGIPADLAYHRGASAAADGRYHVAEASLPRGPVGADRDEALWLLGQTRLGLWDALPAEDRSGPRGLVILRSAMSSFLSEYAGAPASGWALGGLGQAFARLERIDRASRPVDLESLGRDAWSRVGDDGRIAVGLTRLAIRREPNTVAFRDRLLLLFEALNLHAEARAAVRESARVLPDFYAHAVLSFDALSRDLVATFYEASRDEIGRAPLQLQERQLLSLGKLARRLGRLEDSGADLRRALASPGTRLFHAEDAYHLALTLIDMGRYREAQAQLAHAWEFSVFRPAILSSRATIAERQGDLDAALQRLAEQRLLQPRNVGLCLRFADVARRLKAFDRAEEALRWALVLAPDDPAPPRALLRLYLQAGRRADARHVVSELRARGAPASEIEGYEKEIDGAAP